MKKLKEVWVVVLCLSFFACGNDQAKQKASSNEVQKTSNHTKNTSQETSSESDIKLSLNDQIQWIKSNFSTIENELTSFEKKTQEENVGGGVLKREAYFKSNVPQKVISGNYGEHGSIQRTFYLHDNKLFFVFEETFSEAGMSGPFTHTERRYYMYDGELIRVLEKEKTSEAYKKDISKVPNVDVTDQWKSKQNVVSDFRKILRETTATLISNDVASLDDGRWIRTSDPKSGVEIKDGKFIMFYKGTETSPNGVYTYELTEKDGVEYLNLTNENGEKMIYGLLEYSDETMVLSYLNRGNTLTYQKEK